MPACPAVRAGAGIVGGRRRMWGGGDGGKEMANWWLTGVVESGAGRKRRGGQGAWQRLAGADVGGAGGGHLVAPPFESRHGSVSWRTPPDWARLLPRLLESLDNGP